MCKHMNVTNYPRSSTALCTQIYIFFHLNDPSNYIKCFLTCTIPSSPRQGLVPCLALASRFPPAGEDDSDHVDNSSGDDDSHDETLMLSRGIYILSNFMASQTSTQISDFVVAESDDRNAKKSEIIMMIIITHAHLALKQGATTGLVLWEGWTHCVSHVLDHWAQLRDNGIKQLKRIDRKFTITIIYYCESQILASAGSCDAS